MEDLISQETFDKEVAMCKELSLQDPNPCRWGKCENCGVFPLLYKLRYGKILENKEAIEATRKKLPTNQAKSFRSHVAKCPR